MPIKRGALVAVGGIGVLSLAVGVGIAWLGGKHVGNLLPPTEECSASVGGQMVVVDFEQAESAAIIAGVAVRRGLPAARGDDRARHGVPGIRSAEPGAR